MSPPGKRCRRLAITRAAQCRNGSGAESHLQAGWRDLYGESAGTGEAGLSVRDRGIEEVRQGVVIRDDRGDAGVFMPWAR